MSSKATRFLENILNCKGLEQDVVKAQSKEQGILELLLICDSDNVDFDSFTLANIESVRAMLHSYDTSDEEEIIVNENNTVLVNTMLISKLTELLRNFKSKSCPSDEDFF